MGLSSTPMPQDKRSASRKSFTVRGHLYALDGAALCACRFLDVSKSGARLQVETPDRIPDELIVALSRDGLVRRQGKVVWRTEDELGIRFNSPKKPA